MASSKRAPKKGAKIPKLFVLDTNVILHDAGCIWQFEENDLAIPISVLEELDRFKRGTEDIHFQAREFLRKLDELSSDALNDDGASLGEGLGTIRVVLSTGRHQRLREYFQQDTADHRILGSALDLVESMKDRTVIVLSKDTNLRMKAKSLGLIAQDYNNDKVANLSTLYQGRRTIEDVPEEMIASFYRDGGGTVGRDELPIIEDPIPHENFILKNGSMSVLASYQAEENEYVRVKKHSAYGISPRNAEQNFALDALLNDDIKLVTLAGTAGTGKTLLALAAALESRKKYRQILLARPVVPLSNRDLGFLPGDIEAKLDPYMQPLYDNLSVIRNELGDDNPQAQKIQHMRETEKLLVTPLAYIRGRTLQRIFFIIDEAQNLTPLEVKTIITRAGEGTKIVFTGDIHQIDQPYLDSRSNGISYLISRMVGQKLYAHVSLEKGERSELSELASSLL